MVALGEPTAAISFVVGACDRPRQPQRQRQRTPAFIDLP
jgi:hypothetical protein